MNWRIIRYIDVCLGIPIILVVRFLRSFVRRSVPTPVEVLPQKILLVKFWGIGNIFMLLPTIQALRNTFPKAEIHFLTLESNREALNTLSVVNRITTIDTGSIGSFLASWKAAVPTLKSVGYDLAIDFEQFARFSAIVTFQVGAVKSIGYSTHSQHRHHLYSHTIEYDNQTHITQSFYKLAEPAGLRHSFSPNVNLGRFHTLHSRGRRLLCRLHGTGEGPVVVMHIGTSDNFKERRWPPRNYAALADRLMARFGARIVMTGLPEEAFLVAETRRYLQKDERVTDLSGQLSFFDYCSLISVADLVISADTAAVHLASAINVPVVGLYGPNTPLLYGPWGRNGIGLSADFDCSPCITNFNSKINTCRHPDGRGACMKSISVEDAFTAIEKAYCAPEAPSRLVRFARTASESCIA